MPNTKLVSNRDSCSAMQQQFLKNSWRWGWVGLAGLLGGLALGFTPVLAQPNSVNLARDLARNFRPDPIRIQGNASGSVNLASLAGSENCRGFASSQPNHVIHLTENFPLLDLLVYTNNINDDPTLLIKGSNGLVICADDEYQGRNPQVSRRFTEGTYQIWVGASEANKPIKYTLSLSEIRQK